MSGTLPTPSFQSVTLTTPLAISGGGTGASTAAGAITSLGLGAAATLTQTTISDGPGGEGVPLSGDVASTAVVEFATIAALRANTLAFPQVFVKSYAAIGDGGAGLFVYDSADTTSADNGGTIIVDAADHRFYRATAGAVTPQMFGAAGNGTTNDEAAFAGAIAAGTHRVSVPPATYDLGSNPQNFAVSVNWDIAPGTSFTGAGAAIDGGFGTMYTNNTSVAGGPWAYFTGLAKPSFAGAINAWTLELVGPASGTSSQCAMYLGIDSNNNTSSNTLCGLNIVNQVHDADLLPAIGASGGPGLYKALEIDVNVDVSTAHAASSGDIIGLLLTGGGAGGPNQGDAQYGIIFQRTTCNWETAISIANCYFGLTINAQNTGITVQHEFQAATGSSQPSGLINRAFAMDNIPGSAEGGQILAASQIANGYPSIHIWRATDTSPTGTFLRFSNAAASADLFTVDVSGNVAGANATFSGELTLGNAYVSGAPTATGYIVLYDSSGRECKVLTA